MTDNPEEKRPHRLDDHFLGVDPTHSHEDGQADHDHDHDDLGGEYDPTTSSLWQQDNITLLSVGIDIGSAGTQVIFSRVQLRRFSEELTSRYFVVGRESLYQSPVALTPDGPLRQRGVFEWKSARRFLEATGQASAFGGT